MSVVATGAARRHAGCRCPSGVLASLSAAVAHGWGDKDIGELAKFFRETHGAEFRLARSVSP